MTGIAIPERLKSIVTQRQADVDKAKAKRSMGSLTGAIGEMAMTRGFSNALLAHFFEKGKVGVIADIFGASPLSKISRTRFDVMALSEDFRDAGATCVSASPDRRLFRGSIADLATAKAANLPILTYDIVVDQYQILEARYAGADAVLLMTNVLGDKLGEYIARAQSVGLDSLVEVRNEVEIEAALAAGAELVGVNNRDVETLEADLTVCERLIPMIPADRAIAVAVGGLASPEDIERMARAGAKAVRIGSALMAAKEPYEELHRLLGTTPPDDD
ncbi:indole-3-glycerol-phosphate synthase [Methylovirgula sp. HY1]|uniref:indole-3-glycerol phosphate synthase TrpC n=1 Tax=Methylovirgula sp. HY1 TaxID=2822761 RepID=UPI001C5BAABE|nr:indole-3-glycerol phosphate synthase TrpC [Methylovirgula sp. HY1]QXX73997.1 Indole-3-glycerol phosphate synthase [Methylovirgula sp. HY1]